MKKAIIIVIASVLLLVVYYLISPFFINIKLDEKLPVKVNDEATFGLDISTNPIEVKGTSGHPASGTARIVSSGSKNYLRYENFKTINGPDIYIYLAKDLSAKEYISLGRVRATEGNVNYEIPNNVNPREYPYAMVWCRTFGVLFNSAKLY